MAVSTSSPSLAPTWSRAAAEQKIRERLDLGARIQNDNENLVQYIVNVQKWRDYNLELLGRVFTDLSIRSEYYRASGDSYLDADMSGAIMHVPQVARSVGQQIIKLESILERLEFYETVGQETATATTTARDLSKVFVVHGHDEGAREGVARFLEKIGLTAIILREQPNQGRTIIEKFVDCAREVGFAVVLLTPDDLGGAAATEVQQSRARQNVIFELGYFAGSLGRGRACLLRKGEVEIPSDLYGVVYTAMDGADGWKIELARELKAAGFEFDAGKGLA
jgi:predicted nucleotide-binding protein